MSYRSASAGRAWLRAARPSSSSEIPSSDFATREGRLTEERSLILRRVARSGRGERVLEPEADPAHRDHAISQPSLLQLLAEPADRDVQGLGGAVPVLVPHLRHQ